MITQLDITKEKMIEFVGQKGLCIKNAVVKQAVEQIVRALDEHAYAGFIDSLARDLAVAQKETESKRQQTEWLQRKANDLEKIMQRAHDIVAEKTLLEEELHALQTDVAAAKHKLELIEMEPHERSKLLLLQNTLECMAKSAPSASDDQRLRSAAMVVADYQFIAKDPKTETHRREG